jgi:MFS superfamily sulfate permease-like transporter
MITTTATITAAGVRDYFFANPYAYVIVACVLIPLYFLPWLVVCWRRVPNHGSVIVVNVFLGVSYVGWVVALAMACRSETVRQEAEVPAPALPTRSLAHLEVMDRPLSALSG